MDPSRRRKTPTTAATTAATTLKPPRAAPRSPAPRRRRRRRQDQSHADPMSGDEESTHRTTQTGQHPPVTIGGVGRARGVLDFALGGNSGSGSAGAGGGVGQSTATSRGGGDGGSGRSAAAAADEEGLGLLRQQLSAVQRIRVEHERKDATIAALRLEVSDLVRERAGSAACGCCQRFMVPPPRGRKCFGGGREKGGQLRALEAVLCGWLLASCRWLALKTCWSLIRGAWCGVGVV